MRWILLVHLFVFLPYITYSHPGGLDANGGHWDRKHQTYHYHQQRTSSLETPVLKEEFEGRVVSVSDGDTISVMKSGSAVKIRLNGIDAPESSQAFGQKAKQFTSDACFGLSVKVLVRDTDWYGRLVADIVLPTGQILNQMLVASGFAWHYTQYSQDPVLTQLEILAKKARNGLWSDPDPVAPWLFRRE